LRDAGTLAASERVVSFELQRIGEGRGFAGQLARISLRYEPASVNAPATLIAKFASDHAGTLETMRSIDGYAREVRFYRELAPVIGLGTPRCYFAHYDSFTHTCCLLLEDMAPAEPVDPDEGFSLGQAQQVLEQLAQTPCMRRPSSVHSSMFAAGPGGRAQKINVPRTPVSPSPATHSQKLQPSEHVQRAPTGYVRPTPGQPSTSSGVSSSPAEQAFS
jgi:hypothetical protein